MNGIIYLARNVIEWFNNSERRYLIRECRKWLRDSETNLIKIYSQKPFGNRNVGKPRVRSVSCYTCGRETWANDRICGSCFIGEYLAKDK